MQSGILLLDKPAGITSHDLVARTRRALGTRKVGHAGTLDPMATGLMLLGFNSATRLLHFLVGLDKQYETEIQLGISTTTDDFEGEVVLEADCSQITQPQIDAAMASLNGEIEQIPSTFSAIKVAGKKAYELARAGEDVVLAARKVKVSRFERTSEIIREGGLLKFKAIVDCSSGTYVRALARDLGNALSVGGNLLSLRRTKIGKFELSDAQTLGEDKPQGLSMAEAISKVMTPVVVSDAQAIDIRHGKSVLIDSTQERVAAISPDHQLVAVMELSGQRYKSLAVFPQEDQ